MRKYIDTQYITPPLNINELQSTLAEKSRKSSSYSKALLSINGFSHNLAGEINLASSSFLSDWVIDMYRNELSMKTAAHYVDIISAVCSALYKQKGIIPSDSFFDFKRNLKNLSSHEWTQRVSEESLARLTNLIRRNQDFPDNRNLFIDIITICLIEGSPNLYNITVLKRENLNYLTKESREIAQAYIQATRKYVFPLEQSGKTERQLKTYIEAKIEQLLTRYNIGMYGSATETLHAYWSLAALNSGLTGSEILSVINKNPPAIPVLKICCPVSLDNLYFDSLRETVAQKFLSNPLSWFAMRLRQGVSYHSLVSRLENLNKQGFPAPELFYPMEKIARKAGNKLVFNDVPLLPGIVFFRLRPTQVQSLFARIGDLAWCYKSEGIYAAISDVEMNCFQQALGLVSPETQIHNEGAIELQKDDKVIILGGALLGKIGIVQTLRKNNEPGTATGRIIYRLSLPGGNGIEWVADVDKSLLKKLDDKISINEEIL